MKTHNNILVTTLVLIAGIVFICMQSKPQVINAIIIITGILFIASGFINMIIMFMSQHHGNTNGDLIEQPRRRVNAAGMLACLASIVLGTWMTIDPQTLVNIIVYIFAALLLAGGAYQIYRLLGIYPGIRFPWWMYICPCLLIVTGVAIIIIGAQAVVSYIVLVTGIAMVVYAVSSFLEYAGSQSTVLTRRQKYIKTKNQDAST